MDCNIGDKDVMITISIKEQKLIWTEKNETENLTTLILFVTI